MATGVGFLMGPMWGSLMYQIGGFTLPFGSIGKHLFFLILISNDLCYDISLRFLQHASCEKITDIVGSSSQHQTNASIGR